ncbi:MAG: glycosyltransferase family 4 protein [bacterium]
MKVIRPILVSNEAELVGGGEHSFLLLLQGLTERGGIRPLCAVPAEGEVARSARAMGAEVRIWPLPSLKRRPWMWPGALRAVLGDLSGGGIDLVHANGTRAMLLAGRAAGRRGIPVVWHVRVEGGDVLDRFLEGSADVVVVPSRTVGRRFRSARVVPNPVRVPSRPDREASRAAARELLGPGQGPLLVCAGQLTPRKGQDGVVETFARLPAGLRGTLLLAGDPDPLHPGFTRGLRERTLELGLQDQVRFLGWREDLLDLFPGCDLLVHAPRSEGFGRVYVEAMASGLPVVTVPIGGLEEIHEQTGWGRIAPSRDPREMADTIAGLLRHPELLEEMRRTGPEMAREHYSVGAHTEAVAGVYRELMEEG